MHLLRFCVHVYVSAELLKNVWDNFCDTLSLGSFWSFFGTSKTLIIFFFNFLTDYNSTL